MRSFAFSLGAFRLGLSAALALCFPAHSIAGDGGSLDGAWVGQMHQIDTEERTSYPIELTVKGDAAETRYRTLSCGGVLNWVADRDGYSVFKEKITSGALTPARERGCIDGMVTIKPEGNRLVLGWFGVFEGLPTVAYATLTRRETY